MQPLLDEHAHLAPRIEALAEAGDAVGSAELAALRGRVDDVLAFLLHHLLPHATAEEAVLYPAVERLLGPGTTATMTDDHVEIQRLVQQLAGLRECLVLAESVDDDMAAQLRRVLYGLAAVVRLHLSKEEVVFVPALEAGLAPCEAEAMLERMEAAAFHAQARAAGEPATV